ncbi:gamma-glutamylcyclotransferase [Paraburkholderia panacisoli]|uniref:glutathione-specific gamma-glutamylcyclotransferase n=1 Tax=Paraburkholderia panacisoli TaxID=2603818 RepID=A0A5B0G4K6_9BURK|nr:gamma-glutamylcyclotransferase [Paraburkholderia panacisoli]KAA0997638.1 gamma-glutamylcyclotransferase [Paraburkholderia panacisoli]
MLTRESISTGRYLEWFRDVPREMLWTRDRIEESLRATMRLRPDTADVWLFAYGSLIWNPLLYVSDSIPAELHGWHRSFCLRLIAGRGSAMTPGRMLSLEPGGKTAGLALRLHAADLEEELRLLWRREMLTGAYVPTWVQLKLHDERHVWAIAFVADPAHRLYEADASVGSVARLVAHASGPLGTNVDYVFRLEHALQRHGLSDAYVDGVVSAMQRHDIAVIPPEGQPSSK